jgi:hypothetical protein
MADVIGAGSFRWGFTWLQCERTVDGSTNDNPRNYVANGTLWGDYQADSGIEQSEFGAVRETVMGTVIFRGWLNISAKDRLVFQRFGETYLVDGVYRDTKNYQTVCDVHLLKGKAV